MDLGWIWGISGKYLGGIPALVRTSSVELGVSGVDLGWIWPSCPPPPSAKIYRTSVENLLNIYRKSFENLSKINRTSIENLSSNGLRGSLWGNFGIIFGPLLAVEGDFGVLSEPFRHRKALDGDFDACMCGLVGAKK